MAARAVIAKKPKPAAKKLRAAQAPQASEPKIEWRYTGAPDPMAGTGATLIEQLVLWVVGLAGAALMIALAHGGWVTWSWWKTGLAAIIAFDLMGGAAAAALNSSKRFYFSPAKQNERGPLKLLKTGYYLPAISVHPILVYLVYRPQQAWIGLALYLIVGALAILVRKGPLYLARPIAVTSVIIAIVASFYFIDAPPGFEWMLPVLVLKLVLGHAVREEPYRP
jgi:hypothetical protein